MVMCGMMRDGLVYDWYVLTDDEIAIEEESVEK